MNWLSNIKISLKLFLSFAIVLAIMAELGALSLGRMNAMADHAHQISSVWLPGVEHLSTIDTAKSDLRIAQIRFVTAESKEEAALYQQRMQEYVDIIEREKQAYVATIASTEERALWDRFWQLWQNYGEFSAKVSGLVHEGKVQEATQLVKGARDTYDVLRKALRDDVDFITRSGDADSLAAAKIYADSRTLITGLIAAAVALGLLIAIFVGRVISKPLGRALAVFKRISEGHLDNEIETRGRDEVGRLLAGLDDMQLKMRVQLVNERKAAAEFKGQIDAINRVQMVIEYELDGTIITANDAFLRTSRHALEAIRGRNYSMLTGSASDDSEQHRQLWEKLARGEPHSGLSQRFDASGREIWVQEHYNPILDADGKPYKVVQYCTDVTAQIQLTKQMQATVEQTQHVLEAATDGDLTRRLETSSLTGELREMSDGINSLLSNMSDIIRNIKAAAHEVNRGAEEISSGNANLSQRTEEQSSSLEETASSMEEMTSTVRQNADNAGQANQLALAARDQAERGGTVVGKAVHAMSGINEASKKIADIIGVIDEIAFQTNLLALNAAVEAARAGEQGRGFAVVASEVRSLAGRSASAAKEIKDLIQDSVKKVDDGSALVTESGQALEQIVTSVKKVSDIVAEIAAASREQSSGIEQVNRAVMQMDEMTQQNAALVEQSTAASQAMAEQARRLSEMMAHYRVGDSRQSGTAAQSPASAADATAARVERHRTGRPWGNRKSPAAKPSAAAVAPQAAVAAGNARRKF